MKITVECENVREYVDLINQLEEEEVDYTAIEQKRITRWMKPTDDMAKTTHYEFRVVFWV